MFTILPMDDETNYADVILRLTIGLYVLLMGLDSFCLCVTLVIHGSLIIAPSTRLTSFVATVAEILPQALTTNDIDSLNQAHIAGQVFIALGLLGIVAALVALMVALGLLMDRSWAYPATIGLNAVIIVLWLVASLLDSELSVQRLTIIVVNALIIVRLWQRRHLFTKFINT